MLSRIVRTGSRPAISFARSAAYAKSSSRSLIAGTVRSTKPSNVVVNMGIRSMSIETVKLESLGDSITTAVLLSWNKKPGDAVAADDVIGVVETDKVTMDIRSKLAGVMGEQLCKAGDEISVGADIYRVNTDAKSAASAPKASAPVAAAPAPAANAGPVEKRTVNVPIMGESITTGILSSWFSKVGDQLQADHVVAAIETDKVTVEVRTPHAGVLAELLAKAGDEVNVGNPLFVINAGATSAAGATPAPKAAAPAVAKQAAAPAAKPAAPVAAAAAKPAAPKAVAPAAPAAAQGSRTETRVKMTRMRVRIAQRLKESQATAAMLTTFQEVDMHNLIEMRNAYKDSFEKAHGVKLGFMSAFVNASTRALQEIPAVNAVIDDATQEIVYRNYVDVSVAVASPTGLVVPVLRNTEKMGFADVEKAISAYGNKAKNGTLALEEMTGGTFTISNGGVFGSLMGTPIINPPQSAILGMHATKMRPMVMPDGSIKARPMMYLALTYDHRLIDGREAVTFLKSVANKIEDPHRLLLGL